MRVSLLIATGMGMLPAAVAYDARAVGPQQTSGEATQEIDAAPPSAPAREDFGRDDGGVCQIDPSACPTEADVKASRPIRVEWDRVARFGLLELHRRRFELQAA